MAECASIPSDSEDEEHAMPDLSHFSIRKQTSYRHNKEARCQEMSLPLKEVIIELKRKSKVSDKARIL